MSRALPQPVLALSSDEFHYPFSEGASTSSMQSYSLFEPVTCPTNRVHLTRRNQSFFFLQLFS